MSARRRLLGILAVPLAVVATATQASAGQGWEIDVHGGALMSTNPTSGTSALPPAGPDLPLNGPASNSITRRVPSWYLGDGAAILNQILGARSPVKIEPLDPILQSRVVERQSGSSVGVRVDRLLTPRFGVEFALDSTQGQLTLRSTTKNLITASQASFLATWNTLLNAPSGGSQVVTSDAALDDERGRQVVTAGALLINLLSSASLSPYVAVGAGYIAGRNGAPSVTLVGNYDFMFPSIQIAPIPRLHLNDTDTVKIQAVAKNSITWVFGGGVKYAVGKRWGVRADLRDYVNRDVIRINLTTAPNTAFVGSPGTVTFALSQTSPLLIFSSSPLALSTLSTAIADFQTFVGTGVVNQINASAGVFWRF
jgi:opacity protein-like surface antigen